MQRQPQTKVTARILYGTYSASRPIQQKVTSPTALADRPWTPRVWHYHPRVLETINPTSGTKCKDPHPSLPGSYLIYQGSCLYREAFTCPILAVKIGLS